MRRTIFIGVTVIGILVATALPAGAVQVAKQEGSSPCVSVGHVAFSATPAYAAGAPAAYPNVYLWVSAINVYEVPSSCFSSLGGTTSQTAGVDYRIQRWNGSIWAELACYCGAPSALNATPGASVVIPQGSYAQIPAKGWLALKQRGAYRVLLRIGWLKTGAANLGSVAGAWYNFRDSTDYKCLTPAYCAIGLITGTTDLFGNPAPGSYVNFP